MSREYYETIGKPALLANPGSYAWNHVLYFLQFTQSELLEVKEYCDIKDIIYYQTSVTQSFLRQHFSDEIDASIDVDWNDVNKYVQAI